eukprot:gb/GFBE01080020.1/.p1 GENE.gb/GFBE01080020.1/~~gb/GFBE01080020.1/.p1  ORF type:complete len:399 (+),score=67.82 gb/GFBE01080020.1/:1-1197(+)
MVLFTAVVVAGTSTATAALAGVTTALEVVRNQGVLDLLGFSAGPGPFKVPDGGYTRCLVWTGSRWNRCDVAMRGDVLIVSGRLTVGEEALMLSGSRISETDAFVTIVVKAGEPLRVRFSSGEEASAWASQVRIAAALKQDMSELADMVVERKKQMLASQSAPLLIGKHTQEFRMASLTSLHETPRTTRDIGVGRTPGSHGSTPRSRNNMSGSRSQPFVRQVEMEDDVRQTAASPQLLRRELAVPLGVPMYTLSPNPSGADITLRASRSNLAVPPCSSMGVQADEAQIQQVVARKKSPREKSEESPPAKANRSMRRAKTFCTSGIGSPVTSPRDEDSFASKVLTGLGLSPAKASLKAETRVDVLKTRFQEGMTPGRSASQPNLGVTPPEATATPPRLSF